MREHDPLPVALPLHGRAVLILGGGDEARDKIPKLLRAGARLTVIAERLDPALHGVVRKHRIPWFARALHPSDVEGVHLVMLTEPDAELARKLRALKPRHGFWLCAIDQPAVSDVFLVSTVTRGPVQIGISTAGRAPLLARRLRQALECGLDEQFSEFARRFAELRAHLRTSPKERRKEQLESALNGFAMEVSLRYPAGNLLGDGPPNGAREPE